MARGRGGRGFHGRHHGHHHHHHHHRYGGHHHRSGPSQEQVIDRLANSMPVPVVANGNYTHTAGQMSICTQLEQMPNQVQLMAQNGTPVNHLELTIVGTKVEAGNGICVCVTFLFACLIFPLFFCCCNWWKKIAHPAYEVNTSTYQAVANALSAVPTLNNVTLNVVDNAFNSEKAQMIYNMIGGRQLLAFKFSNMALQYDWRQDEFSRFEQNMQPVFSLGVPCEISWGDEILGV